MNTTKNSGYKRRNFHVPAPKGMGQINFKVNEKAYQHKCILCAKVLKNRQNLQGHLSGVHQLSAEVVSRILDSDDPDAMLQDGTLLMTDIDEYDDNDLIIEEEEQVSYDVFGGDDSDDDIDDDDDTDDDEAFNNPLYETINHYMTSNASEEDVSMLTSAIGSDSIWNTYTESCHPFRNLQTMILQSLVDGDNDMISRRSLKKILVAFNLLLTVKEKYDAAGITFKLPTLNAIFKYQTSKRNKIPLFQSKQVNTTNTKNETVELYVNLPSEHLKHAMANPKKSMIASVPDRTLNQKTCPQQGEKWRTHRLFQQPMWTVRGIDYWQGDLVYLHNCPTNVSFLVESFHCFEDSMYSRGFIVRQSADKLYTGIELQHTDVKIDNFASKINSSLNHNQCYSITMGQTFQLQDYHRELLTTAHHLKKLVPGKTDTFYKVKIAPVILFTDDTSGNRSKQFNPFESWSMKFAALPFEERCSVSNICFLGAVQKKDGVSGTSLLPVIVDDIEKLEKGVVMFSAQDEEDVIVAAPLIWLEADTPCHSELCGLSAPTSRYPCRKCYIRLNRKLQSNGQFYTVAYPARTKDHYLLASQTPDRSTVIPHMPGDGAMLKASDLNFTSRGTDALLKLESFDPAQDTPVEILHTVLLGIGKYMVNDLVKTVLKPHRKQLDDLTVMLNQYQKVAGLSRKFSKQLAHCGSYLGRDFKILLQILPIILTKDFSTFVPLQKITKLFVKLGKICSLVFIRKIDCDFDCYISEVQRTIDDFVLSLFEYDKELECSNKHKPYVTKPKVHMLTHLAEDIRRFGCALNFETEKGEQFNKHIREHLFFTNRENCSRDIALKFGKQSSMRLIVDGGSWLNAEGKRERPGAKILQFVRENEYGILHYFFGGTRDFENNNGDKRPKSLSVGSLAVFTSSSCSSSFLGFVCDNKVQKLVIHSYTFDNGGFALAKETNVVKLLSEVQVEQLLDGVKITDQYLINFNKFGSYWFFMRNINDYASI